MKAYKLMIILIFTQILLVYCHGNFLIGSKYISRTKISPLETFLDHIDLWVLIFDSKTEGRFGDGENYVVNFEYCLIKKSKKNYQLKMNFIINYNDRLKSVGFAQVNANVKFLENQNFIIKISRIQISIDKKVDISSQKEIQQFPPVVFSKIEEKILPDTKIGKNWQYCYSCFTTLLKNTLQKSSIIDLGSKNFKCLSDELVWVVDQKPLEGTSQREVDKVFSGKIDWKITYKESYKIDPFFGRSEVENILLEKEILLSKLYLGHPGEISEIILSMPKINKTFRNGEKIRIQGFIEKITIIYYYQGKPAQVGVWIKLAQPKIQKPALYDENN